MFSVLVIRLRSLRLLRVSGIVMRLRMFLLLFTFLKCCYSFRNCLLVIFKYAYLYATLFLYCFFHFLRLLMFSGIVMRLRMLLLLITFLKASHSFSNRLLVIYKNAYLFATMIMTSVSSPFSCCSGIVRLNLM